MSNGHAAAAGAAPERGDPGGLTRVLIVDDHAVELYQSKPSIEALDLNKLTSGCKPLIAGGFGSESRCVRSTYGGPRQAPLKSALGQNPLQALALSRTSRRADAE